MRSDGKLSTSEQIKSTSNGLRGTIPHELQLPASRFSRANALLLKFHGVFQQDDRDERLQRRLDGEELDVEFTVRVARNRWTTHCQPDAGNAGACRQLSARAVARNVASGTAT